MSDRTKARSVQPRSRQEDLRRFRALNESPSLLLLPGAWDFVSARMLAAEGFAAIGTTSSGVCWSVGRGGGWDSFLAASARIVEAVEIPVSLDIEAGFALTPEGVAEHVLETIEVGACGINLEDGLTEGGLGDANLLVDKIQAVREACTQKSYPLYLNARTDVFLGGFDDLAEAIRRGQRYAEAGADMFFAPGIAKPEEIATVLREVPIPLNVYAVPGLSTIEELAGMGVRRLSVGCGILQSALADARRRARAFVESGAYGFVDDGAPFEEVESLCVE